MQLYGHNRDWNFGHCRLPLAEKPNIFFSITFYSGPSRVGSSQPVPQVMVEGDPASEMLWIF